MGRIIDTAWKHYRRSDNNGIIYGFRDKIF